MKKLILILALFIANSTLAGGTQPLKNELTQKLIIDLSDVELSENHEDYVYVSFYICNDEIEITEITGTQTELTQKVKAKLSQLEIEEEYNEGTLYHYRFTFDKI